MSLFKDYVITTDCAGSIGEKIHDQVKIDYYTLAYFTLRNAIVENLSKGGTIEAIIYSNFISDNSLEMLSNGMKQVLKELNLDVEILGSTESNFNMKESAFAVTVIGKKSELSLKRFSDYAVIGIPLVGDEVVTYKQDVISLEEIMLLLKSSTISRVFPIGSKGINDRMNTILGFEFESQEIDLYKSAGPSTCVAVEYENYDELIVLTNKKITKLYRGKSNA